MKINMGESFLDIELVNPSDSDCVTIHGDITYSATITDSIQELIDLSREYWDKNINNPINYNELYAYILYNPKLGYAKITIEDNWQTVDIYPEVWLNEQETEKLINLF